MNLLESAFLILSTAVFGWLTASLMIRFIFKPSTPKKIAGFSFIGMVPSMLPGLVNKLAGRFNLQISALITEKVNAEEQRILTETRPLIEEHVDHFLKVKLKTAFPLLHNFMGEKTFVLFKASFMEEVELLLPGIWRMGVDKVVKGSNYHEVITEKLNLVNWANVGDDFTHLFSAAIRRFKLSAALCGALLGILQVSVMYLLRNL
jgi:hypothetical protein